MSEEMTAPETVAEPAIAPEQTAAPEAVTEAQQPAEQTEAPPVENKAKERLSLRFSELTSQREAAKAEAEYWRQQALNRQSYEPDPAYDDNSPFDPQSIEAAVERAVESRLQREAETRAQNARQQTVQQLQTTLLESGLDGAALIASGADIPFTQAMFDALTVSEQPAVIADHLGRNPTEAGRIAALSPAQQGVELARLEARLASQPRTTNAPPPPNTVGTRAVASTDPAGMSFEQYKAAREAGRI